MKLTVLTNGTSRNAIPKVGLRSLFWDGVFIFFDIVLSV